jgi:isorenieratene synthase
VWFEKQRVPPRRRGGSRRAPPGASAVVAGGGIAGIAAATVLAERGVRVTLVEREPFLGGRAGAWTDRLADGTSFQMERGFHAFFRQYYNLRALLARIDPALPFLAPLVDYPLLGPDGARESFRGLPRLPVLNAAALLARSPSVRLRDLLRVDARRALAMLRYDGERTRRAFDGTSARDYLDSIGLPPKARRMLFDVFSHSFFNPEEAYSAAELLMMFHLYFLGNPEGLVFDVAREPFSTAIFAPLHRRLEALGARVLLGARAERVEGPGPWTVVTDAGVAARGDAVVLALAVPALQHLVAASPSLGDGAWRRRVRALAVTRPFAVLRLWLDRPCAPDRAAFAGTTGLGLLDNVSVYDRFEGESRRWAAERGGAVVELHAYALPDGVDADAVRRDLVARLGEVYPETRRARILDERLLVRRDCPAFPPGSCGDRLGVATPSPGLAVAGDMVELPFPTALMERAASSGILAANELLALWGVEEEPLWSIPPRGPLACLPAWIGRDQPRGDAARVRSA